MSETEATHQVIPEAAVEAAARAMCAAMMKNVEDPWSVEAEFYRDHLRRNARAALEAAAPHMLDASVWHDAVSGAYVDGALSADQAAVMYNANPYRPTP